MNTPLKKKKNRNRSAGHGFEITVRNWFRDIGFSHLVTSRSESRSRDAQKIDLINKDEGANGRFPYNIQCKNVCTSLKYHTVLKEIHKSAKAINVVIHKWTAKSKEGKFMEVGTFAILDAKDFVAMCERLRILEGETRLPTNRLPNGEGRIN